MTIIAHRRIRFWIILQNNGKLLSQILQNNGKLLSQILQNKLPSRKAGAEPHKVVLLAKAKHFRMRLEQRFANCFSRAPLALVIDTRATPNPKIKHKKQNIFFAIILLFNNVSLLCSPPSCEPFTLTSLRTQRLKR